MKDLLGRSFRAIGNYYGEQVEEHYKKLKRETQEKNLRDHAERLGEVLGDPPAIEPSQIVKIERWIKIAADIPVDDTERAAILEAAFADIISTQGSSDYQEAAEQLSSSTARLFLNAPTRHSVAPGEGDELGFEQLKALGLAGTSPRPILNRVFAAVVGTIIGLLLLFGVIIRDAANFFPHHFPAFLATEFIVEGVVATALIVGFGISFISKQYRLTTFGKSLQRSARRFYPRQLNQHGWLPFAGAQGVIVWSGIAALLVCTLPFVLEAYLPGQLRIDVPPRTIIITSPPATPTSQGRPSAPPAAPTSPAGPAPQDIVLDAEEIRTLIDVWRSVVVQTGGIISITSAVQGLILDWPQSVKVNRAPVIEELTQLKAGLSQQRTSLQSLYAFYRKYPGVSALDEVNKSGGVFDRFYGSLDTFAREIKVLQNPLPENFENTLRPYAGEVKAAQDAMARWANGTRNFANQQGQELSK